MARWLPSIKMQKLAFFELSRPVQERFVEAARGAATPAPLAFRSAFPRRVAIWSGLTLLALLSVYAVAKLGYGDLSSSLALSPTWLIGVYAVLLSFAAFCGVEALAASWARRALPYRPGVYLFPSGIVNASQPRFEVYRLLELDVTKRGSKAVRLQHKSGAVFDFDTPDAERARASILEFKERLGHAERNVDARELVALDPLKDTGFASPFSPVTPIRRPRPSWFRFALPLAVLSGLPLGWLVWRTRNAASESALYKHAREKDDVQSYQAYLARGGKRADVSEVLLPRAELERARRTGTVDAIEEFITRRPNSKVHAEAIAALKAALLVELEKAKKTRSLRAIRALPTEHPRHANLIQVELGQAVRDSYSGALAEYKKHAPAANASTLAFIQRLLKYAETHSPVVHVRFVEHVPESHDLADLAVKNSTYFVGTRSLPSQYFNQDHVIAREKIAGKELITDLQKAFSPEILKFELGPRLREPKAAELEVKLPTLFIEHTTRLSGTYVSAKPRGVFMGVSMLCHARFQIPSDEQTLEVKHSAWNPPNVDLLKQEDSPKLIYETAALESFRGFNRKLLSKLLAKP